VRPERDDADPVALLQGRERIAALHVSMDDTVRGDPDGRCAVCSVPWSAAMKSTNGVAASIPSYHSDAAGRVKGGG
jgi:hypothetical protein